MNPKVKNTNPFKKGDRVEAIIANAGLSAGARFTVEEATTGGYLKFVGFHGWYSCTLYKKVEHETIIIVTDGDFGKAKLLKGGKLVKEVMLTRDKGDKHNMKTLAAYAVQKLIPDDGNMIINVKAGYTGSVCVVNSTNPNYKNGKIFEFVGGKCINSTYPFSGKEFNTVSEINKYCKGYHINFNVLELHRQ